MRVGGGMRGGGKIAARSSGPPATRERIDGGGTGTRSGGRSVGGMSRTGEVAEGGRNRTGEVAEGGRTITGAGGMAAGRIRVKFDFNY